MMAAILNSAILNSDTAILDSAILVIFFQIHSKTLCQDPGSQHLSANKFNLTQTHSFWLNLIMAAILKSTMLDSDTAILDSDTLVIFLSDSLTLANTGSLH